MTNRFACAGTLLMLAFAASCARQSAPPEGTTTATPAPAPNAASASYSGIETGPITLTNGVWEDAPVEPGGRPKARVELVRDFTLRGDLDGDQKPDEIVLLSKSGGASGTFDYFAVLAHRDNGVVNVGTAALGDRVRIFDATIENGALRVAVIRAGPNDAMCCPTEKAALVYTLANGTFSKTSDQVLGTASLADIGGVEWVLTRFAWDEAAPAEPEVTLQLDGERFVGRGGCNRYIAPVKTGKGAGEITVGPPAGTRMACPPPASELERRYFDALATVNQYSFIAGHLALTYSPKDGGLRALQFKRKGTT